VYRRAAVHILAAPPPAGRRRAYGPRRPARRLGAAEVAPQEAAVPRPAHRRAAVASLAIALTLAPAPPPPAAAARVAVAPGAAPLAAPGNGVAPVGAVAADAVPVEAAAAPRVPALRLPVSGAVVRGFEEPAGPYGPGHRGVDVRAPVGTPVAAPAAGTVTFAGRVAGSAWVSLLVAPGVVVTVGPLRQAAVAAGERVPALAPVGRLAAGHVGAVHLSLRVDGAYVDPLPWLVDRPRPRLAPLPVTA
jgi:murein DD-endopeptidase MepM/ murein hydrolase activator NlpD